MTKILLLILILFSLTGCTKKPPPSSTPKTNNEPVNTVDIKDRPYVTLAPTVGGRHPLGQEVTLTIHSVTLGSTLVEYELEYQAGTLIQGAFGTIDLNKETPPVNKDLLFGSCSTGGKCAYHKDVTGGTLILRFKGGSQNFALKGEWNVQNMSERAGKFSSRDAKFQLEVAKAGLPANSLIVIAQTMGLPKPVEGEIVAGPYRAFHPSAFLFLEPVPHTLLWCTACSKYSSCLFAHQNSRIDFLSRDNPRCIPDGDSCNPKIRI